MIELKQKLTTFVGLYVFKKDIFLVSCKIGFNNNEMRKIKGKGVQRNKCGGHVLSTENPKRLETQVLRAHALT